MTLHILLCTIMSTFTILEYLSKMGKINIKFNDFFFYLSILTIIIFGFVRDPYWGVDSLNYEQIYFTPSLSYTFKDILNLEFFSIPFFILTRFITLFTANYQIYKGIILIITLIGPVLLINKYSSNKSFSFFIFFSITALQVLFSLRQSISMSLFFIAVYLYLEKKYLFSAIFWFIACMMHTIAIVSFLTFILFFIKKRINAFISFILVILSFLFFDELIIYFLHFYRHGLYINVNPTGGGYNLLFFSIFVLVCIYFFLDRHKCKNKKDEQALNFYYNNYLVSVCLQTISIKIATFNRTRAYFIFYLSLLLPNLIDDISLFLKIKKEIVVLLFLGVLSAFYLYTVGLKYPYII